MTENQLSELARAMFRKSRRNRGLPVDENAADDIAQDAWMKYLEHGESDDPERTFRACVSYSIKEFDAQDQRFPQRCTPSAIDETLHRNALTLDLDSERESFSKLLSYIGEKCSDDERMFATCLALTDTFTQACTLWAVDRKQGYRLRDRILAKLGV